MPRVSVIVPNYNHGRFLERRLRSIFEQTLQDFELIFLDDASTDGSLEVFRGYRDDPRVRHKFYTENSGSPFVQWNRGIQMARGEYVWIAESDDFCDTKFLEVLVGKLDENPNVGIAYCQSWVISEDDEKLKRVDCYDGFADASRWSQDFVNSGREEVVNYLVTENCIPNASAVVFRRAVLNGDLSAPEHMKLCGDWYFWTRILCRSDVVFVAEPMNYFRDSHRTSQRKTYCGSSREIEETAEVQKAILAAADPSIGVRAKMLWHFLRRWASVSWREQKARDWDRRIHRGLAKAYGSGGRHIWTESALIGLYHYFVIPVMKTRLFRKTLGAWKLSRENERVGPSRHQPRGE